MNEIIYDEPASAYHASGCYGSTDLRNFLKSPQLLADIRAGIVEKKTSAAMAFGTLTHLYFLERHRYLLEAVSKPEGMDYRSKDGKAWRDGMLAQGRTIVDRDDAERICLMQERMPQEVRDILETGKPEVTFRTEIDGVKYQCRVDWWQDQLGFKYDLKTIANMDNLERDFFKYGYHIQDAFYSLIIGEVKGEKPRRSRSIFVETASPYRWKIIEMDLDAILLGEAKAAEAMAGIARCVRSGDWSDTGELHEMISPPTYLMETEDDEESEG